VNYKNNTHFERKNLSKSPNSLNLSLPIEGIHKSGSKDQFKKSIDFIKEDKRKSVPNSKNLFSKTYADNMVPDQRLITETHESIYSQDKMPNYQNTHTKSQDRMCNPVLSKKSSPGIL